MQETRRARLAAVMLEELSTVIPRELKDPRIPSLTITRVEVAPDGSAATVFVMRLGAGFATDADGKPFDEEANRKEMQGALDGLASASGFLRRHLAKILTIRHIPTLTFKEDRGFENTIRVHELLKKINET